MKTEDLGVKIGTKVEVFWTDLKGKCEQAIFNAEQTMIADKELLKLAEKKIEEEKRKI